MRAAERQAAKERRAAAAELDKKEEKKRYARREKVYAQVRSYRLKYYEEQGHFATKADVWTWLLQPGGGGWGRRSMHEGLPLTYGEMLLAWDTGPPLIGFIDASKLYGSHLLWADVPELAPIAQRPDHEGRIALRTNSKTVRKIPRAKECWVEGLMFVTGVATG